MDKYQEMLERANKRYKYSEIELGKITSLLDYCHAVDVRMTHTGECMKFSLSVTHCPAWN